MRYLVKGLIGAMAVLFVAAIVVPAQAAESDLEMAYRAFIQAAMDKNWQGITNGSSMEAREEL